MADFEIISMRGLVSEKKPLDLIVSVAVDMLLKNGRKKTVDEALKKMYGSYNKPNLQKTPVAGGVHVEGTIMKESIGWMGYGYGVDVTEMPTKVYFPEWMQK